MYRPMIEIIFKTAKDLLDRTLSSAARRCRRALPTRTRALLVHLSTFTLYSLNFIAMHDFTASGEE
jgi:hypothetical protein